MFKIIDGDPGVKSQYYAVDCLGRSEPEKPPPRHVPALPMGRCISFIPLYVLVLLLGRTTLSPETLNAKPSGGA